MYNKTSFINETDYVELVGYAGFAQLCGRSPIMREIMRAHNRIIPRSLVLTARLAESNGSLPLGL